MHYAPPKTIHFHFNNIALSHITLHILDITTPKLQ